VTKPDDIDLPLSILRIYLRRRRSMPGRGFWGRLFGRTLSYDLAERALEAGVTYATVTLGHAGFVPGARRIVVDAAEAPPATLPSCVELVAPRAVLDAFVEANRDELVDAVLLRLDGVAVSLYGTVP
jgi:PII-like signaling protein